jgi:CrcB protein
MTVLLVAGFGVIGVLARYFLNAIPWATFWINLLGSFLIGIVASCALRIQMPDNLRIGLMAGMLGGFTTFSAYSLESLLLIQQAKYALAAAYFIGTPVLGFLAVYIGFWVGKCF